VLPYISATAEIMYAPFDLRFAAIAVTRNQLTVTANQEK
jgi:hypothetical protein